jgi:uncharacterized protein
VGALELFGLAVNPVVAIVALLVISLAAGCLGSMLGLGGGVVLVPTLILIFGLEAHLAIAASLVTVIATSTGAASRSPEHGFTNVRIAMFLEVATSVGGLAGAVIAVTVLAQRGDLLVFAFVPVVLGAGISMYLHRERDVEPGLRPDRLSRVLRLKGTYPDPVKGTLVPYEATRSIPTLAVAGLAGLASGLLGIGGGLFKVPAMNSVMNLPMRVAGATSTFMIGVTAAASALVYLFAGDVVLLVVGPAVLGIVLGSRAGVALRVRVATGVLKQAFVIVLVLTAASMLAQATGVIR